MQRFWKKEHLSFLLAIIAILGFIYGAITERQYVNNWADIGEFFKSTDQIESITLYGHINDEKFIYSDKVKIQELIKPFRYTNRISKPREIMKQNVVLLYSMKVFLTDDWTEEMEIYYADKEIYKGDEKVSFKVNDKHYVLLFRDSICYIDVISE
jgi:hypothetical protein